MTRQEEKQRLARTRFAAYMLGWRHGAAITAMQPDKETDYARGYGDGRTAYGVVRDAEAAKLGVEVAVVSVQEASSPKPTCAYCKHDLHDGRECGTPICEDGRCVCKGVPR